MALAAISRLRQLSQKPFPTPNAHSTKTSFRRDANLGSARRAQAESDQITTQSDEACGRMRFKRRREMERRKRDSDDGDFHGMRKTEATGLPAEDEDEQTAGSVPEVRLDALTLRSPFLRARLSSLCTCSSDQLAQREAKSR